MRILHLISSAGFYGAESVLVNLSIELQHRGYGCVVGVFENSENTNTEVGDRAEKAGLAVRRVLCRGRIDWQTVRRIRAIIEEEEIDLVHAHGYKADSYALLAARLAAVPVTATCHNWLGRSRTMRAYACIDRYLLRFFDAVAAVSGPVAEQLKQAGIEKRMQLIPNGVAVPSPVRPPSGTDRSSSTGRIVVGTVGRLSEEKGAAFLIEAASKICSDFPQAFFVLVGDGPLRSLLEQRVRALGIDKQFLFTGQRGDMDQMYRSFDIYVLPSLEEGMPVALLEAMAASLPVVATKVGGVPDVINDPSVGTLVAPRKADELAEGIRDLLDDRSRREQMGANAKKRIEEQFSAAAMARRYSELYQQALLRRRAGNRGGIVATRQAGTDATRRPQS